MSDACPGYGNGLFCLCRVHSYSEAAPLDMLHPDSEEATRPHSLDLHTLPRVAHQDGAYPVYRLVSAPDMHRLPLAPVLDGRYDCVLFVRSAVVSLFWR